MNLKSKHLLIDGLTNPNGMNLNHRFTEFLEEIFDDCFEYTNSSKTTFIVPNPNDFIEMFHCEYELKEIQQIMRNLRQENKPITVNNIIVELLKFKDDEKMKINKNNYNH